MQKLSVYITLDHDIKVGVLAEEKGNVHFEYDVEFIERGLEISPLKLPLSQSYYQNSSGPGLYRLPGVIYDSLPDGWGMLIMDRVFRNHGLQPERMGVLDRLAYLGSRAMGAMRYEPSKDLAIGEEFKHLDLGTLAKEADAILRGDTESIIKEIYLTGGSPGGARPKALVGLNTDTDEAVYGIQKLPVDFEYYVVKFPGHDDPVSIGIVEFVYSLMAKDCGIDMPDTHLVCCDEERYFAIKRFDRTATAKIHAHTLAGMLHSDFRKPEITYEHYLKVTAFLTNDNQMVQQAFRRMVFNVLAFNRDDHAKNFSFIMDKNGKWSLSPAYDLVYSTGMGGWHTLDISGSKNPSRQEMLTLAIAHGIKKIKAQQIIEQVMQAVSRWRQLAKNYGVRASLINDIQKSMRSVG